MRPDSSKKFMFFMNTVIYVNYRKYFAQIKPLSAFSYVCLKMAGVVDDEFKRVR